MSGGVSCGYHCTAKTVSFGRGESAVHTAAYNQRTQLYDERNGRDTRDYSHHTEVLFSGVFAPKDAPEWVHDRQELWNRAEAAERQINGQPARNMIVALPHELDQQQREWLLKDFAREQFARKGMIADVAMHAPDKVGDQRNIHAHIMLTMRQLDGDVFAKTKSREWNSKAQLNEWREAWAEKGANALTRAGHPVEAERWRHGHRTLAAQRTEALKRGDKAFAESLDREATLHKGPTATAKERRKEQSDRIDALRGILDRNEIRTDLKQVEQELRALEKEQARQLKQEPEAKPRAVEPQLVEAKVPKDKAPEAKAPEPKAAEPVRAEAPGKPKPTRQKAAAPATTNAQKHKKARVAEAKPAPVARPPERSIVAIAADHANADAQILRQPVARAFAQGAIQQAQEIKQDRREAKADATQNDWKNRTGAAALSPVSPAKEVLGVAKSAAITGLRVADGITGKIAGLADFVIDFLSGSSGQPAKTVDMGFTMDPKLRKEQQLARSAAQQQEHDAREAIENIEDHIKKGRNLSPSDVRHLTQQHLEQIKQHGDDGMRAIIEEARKWSERNWRSDGRERD